MKKTKAKPVAFHVDSGVHPASPEQLNVTPYPEAGKKVEDFEVKLDAQIAGGPTEAPKRGRGRPPKQPEPEPQQPEISPDIICGIIKIPFEFWATSQNLKELALTDTEAKQLAGPIKQLIDYYLPRIPTIAYAWISLSVTVFWISKSRLEIIAEIKRKKHKSSLSDEGKLAERMPPVDPSRAQAVSFPEPDDLKPEKL